MSYNTAQGVDSLFNLTGTYDNNTAVGYNAGRYQADGVTSLTSADSSLYLGAKSMGLNNSD